MTAPQINTALLIRRNSPGWRDGRRGVSEERRPVPVAAGFADDVRLFFVFPGFLAFWVFFPVALAVAWRDAGSPVTVVSGRDLLEGLDFERVARAIPWIGFIKSYIK